MADGGKGSTATPANASAEATTEVRVWDPVVRLFHWALAIAVGIGWYLGEFRSFTTIEWHFWLGYTVGGLVVLRLLWGLVGPRPARLSSLAHSPGRTVRYLGRLFERRPSNYPGHSPIGSLSVIALLLSLLVQVGTGLFAEDDGLFSEGPLSGYASSDMVLQLTAIHSWNSRVLLALIALHVTAILFYAVWKRENLVAPMITGRKRVPKTDVGIASGGPATG